MPKRRIPKVFIKPKNSRDVINPTIINKVNRQSSMVSPDKNTQNVHGEFFKDSAYMMKDIIFVAYYTFNTPYEGEAEKLKASFDKYLPAVINGDGSGIKRKLTESVKKEVTGDREIKEETQPENDVTTSNIIDIKKLAGLN